ncbi:zinc ribbon domain-containing protein [Actinomadura harenae]|uniref:TerB family tellurite resistance protein n=1 Tax=Actinomadura harenae TaxID=2483351 RepID=A0A3M2LU16_9ACTN|nr:hypothetical protein [Actinomadura harenae]RMI40606.1 hypothetical protein EBO15_26130 [Actinomadura harenae]
MLIIFGFRVVYFTLDRGVFHCPNCGGDRDYRRRQGRNFFTLFFIPLLPLNRTGPEIAECDTCHGRWTTAVLAVPTSAQLGAMPGTLLRMAVVQVLRSGDVTFPGARERAVEVVRQAGADYDTAALDADLGRSFDDIRVEMARSADTLAPEARENILRAAAEIALLDGPLTFSEEETLNAVGADLALTRVQITGVLSLARESSGH